MLSRIGLDLLPDRAFKLLYAMMTAAIASPIFTNVRMIVMMSVVWDAEIGVLVRYTSGKCQEEARREYLPIWRLGDLSRCEFFREGKLV